MTRLSRLAALIVSVGLFVVLSLPAPARADVVEACVNAHATGQVQRDEGKYLEAREQFLTCVSNDCPKPVQLECTGFLTELDEAMPTVVLSARDENERDVAAATLEVDGVPREGAMNGRAHPMNPGRHVLRFEHPDGRVAEVIVIVQESVKNRTIVGRFEAPTITEPEPVVTQAPDSRPSWLERNQLPVILGGVGVLALGSFTYFALSGNSERDRLEATCAPDCPSEEVDSVSSKYLIADVSLAVSAIALGAGTYFFLTPTPAATERDVTPTGFLLGTSGRF